MKFVFWNVGRRRINHLLLEVLAEHAPDILALAEYQDDEIELANSSRVAGWRIAKRIGCTHILILTRLANEEITPRTETDRYTIQEIRVRGKGPILVAFVHLPSKLHRNEDDQLALAQLVREDVESTEIKCGHTNTMVLGDFNMNPFDNGMTSALAFNSVSCSKVAGRHSRAFGGKKCNFFYNPSWRLLGDVSGGPGTYFHSTPGVISSYWNALDQVILRPALAGLLVQDSLVALTMVGQQSLVSSNGTPSCSDHLPITFKLQY